MARRHERFENQHMIVARSEADSRRYVDALASIGRHPDTEILRALSEGPRRFNEIAAELAHVGDDALGAGLRELDAGGLVVRRVDPGPPLRVLYELTLLGQELAPALCVVAEWAGRAESA